MPDSSKPPTRLVLKDGVLSMRDGSNLQQYLKGSSVANTDAVVILARAGYDSLVHDALQWRLHQERLMANDESFIFAA